MFMNIFYRCEPDSALALGQISEASHEREQTTRWNTLSRKQQWPQSQQHQNDSPATKKATKTDFPRPMRWQLREKKSFDVSLQNFLRHRSRRVPVAVAVVVVANASPSPSLSAASVFLRRQERHQLEAALWLVSFRFEAHIFRTLSWMPQISSRRVWPWQWGLSWLQVVGEANSVVTGWELPNANRFCYSWACRSKFMHQKK